MCEYVSIVSSCLISKHDFQFIQYNLFGFSSDFSKTHPMHFKFAPSLSFTVSLVSFLRCEQTHVWYSYNRIHWAIIWQTNTYFDLDARRLGATRKFPLFIHFRNKYQIHNCRGEQAKLTASDPYDCNDLPSKEKHRRFSVYTKSKRIQHESRHHKTEQYNKCDAVN